MLSIIVHRIGLKGNGTCELSAKVVRETVDLKPIGTRKDTDYDLYIKKLGCKLVLDKNNYLHEAKPNSFTDNIATSTEQVRKTSKPDEIRPIYEPNRYEPNSYEPKPAYDSQDSVHHVQTLIAISPARPQTAPEDTMHFSGDLYKPQRPNNEYGPPTNNYNQLSTNNYQSSNKYPPAPNKYPPGPSSYPSYPALSNTNNYDNYPPPGNNYLSRPTNDYDRPVYQRPYPEDVDGMYGNYRPYAPNEPYRPLDRPIPHRPSYYEDNYDYRPSYENRPIRPLELDSRPVGAADNRPPIRPYEDPYPPRPLYERPQKPEDANRPPFRPEYLNHPYEEDDYVLRKPFRRPYMDYYNEMKYHSDDENYIRPHGHNNKGDVDYHYRPYDSDNPNYYPPSGGNRNDYGATRPVKVPQKPYESTTKSYDGYYNSSKNKEYGTRKPLDRYGPDSSTLSSKFENKKPIITQGTSANGRPVTSIITELDNSKFTN